MSIALILVPCLIAVEPGIQAEADCRAHMDYVHINPVKHELVRRVADWPCSMFHHLVAEGVYPPDWAGGVEMGWATMTEYPAQCPPVIAPYMR